MSFIRHHRIQCSLTMFKISHYHVVKLNETEPKSVFWFFMRLSGDVTRMSEWKGVAKDLSQNGVLLCNIQVFGTH